MQKLVKGILNNLQEEGEVITVVLNLLVIISVSHFRQLHSPTNTILLSLAVSDFLVGLLLLPLEIYRNTSCWFLGEIVCAVYYFLGCYIPYTSIGNIVLISVDRYVAICHPLHYPTTITAVKAKLYATGVVDLILTFVLPVTAIVVLYMKVFVVAVIQARSMRSHVTFVSVQHPVKVKAKKSELKAARTLGVLVFTYLLCFCPLYCYTFIDVNLTDTSNMYLLTGLFYFNSCLNPVIYTLFYPWFRKAVKVIITLQILNPDSCETNML
ncbi:trace amine-associated receptor 13c-like [Oryzias melastigma]|uniref:trace amine-associated receptor 13c-like n=1 Tax=Oryzias melastigma TaxID=30732 RepID=UPI00168D167F|nr:trace amine-associated receptor 13c-like [Oryzias melastigma]